MTFCIIQRNLVGISLEMVLPIIGEFETKRRRWNLDDNYENS